MKRRIYWTTVEHEDWRFYLAATEKGLCFIGSPNGPLEEVKKWADRTLGEYELVADNLSFYKRELAEYLDGDRETFSQPVDLHGTAFQRDVWETLETIGYGETSTYSQVAEQLGRPKAIRAVASAIGSNPVLIAKPCHRVIGKDGSLTGYRGGLEMKKLLLEMERNAKRTAL
ncbi:methylated-DNA--[protein]-cysteine S-methyltransferase [Natribacillus halophilus]|uniref:methylated-DNA--[protein]-cysteine S-methyltransferase n=1 Tax=Natribacillus halophilus TaxID=549003 RepID=A0A1G8SB00_9BACI|nr:methylated-DNA--[protein]-cysteine S-methyltransferase [Natribacillus halophilus]SDJ26377.1 methylated-DNA-[protein]-cysteine S-methyltransferase [Natribacillus halophilus]